MTLLSISVNPVRTNTKNIFFGICQQRLDLFRLDDIFLEIRSYI